MRAKSKQRKDRQRLERHLDELEYIRERCREERRYIWFTSYRDVKKDETVSTLPPIWTFFEQGEVLLDSRGQGSSQRMLL